MCPEKSWNLVPKQQVIVPTWYMKHVFKDSRGSWRCLSFATSCSRWKKQLYKSRVEVARSSLSLKRNSAGRVRAAPAAASLRNREASSIHSKCRWMRKSFIALHYNCSLDVKRFKATKTKDSTCFRMKHFINSSLESREAALSPSSSSMNELIPSIDFDLESEFTHDLALISTCDDSDIGSTGAPPSRRSSASFYYPPTPETAFAAESGHYKNNLPSPYQSAKQQRRKSATIVREVKNSSASGGADRRQHSTSYSHYHHHGPFVNDAAALAARVSSARKESWGNQSRQGLSPDTATVNAIVTMDTASSSPANRSLSTQGWLDVYDLMTESLSSFAPSEKANSVVDVQIYTPTQRSFSGPLPLGGGPPRRDFRHQGPNHHPHHKKAGSVHSFSQRHPSIASSVADYNDPPRRSVSSIGSQYNHQHQHLKHPPPAPRPVSTQKDFQEAIVDIILENDVNDLVDLEEFLQGYFRLNTLYQEIIQQFFNDLSNDLVNPRVSRAPSVFARLASRSHNAKPQSSSSRAKDLGKTKSSKKPT